MHTVVAINTDESYLRLVAAALNSDGHSVHGLLFAEEGLEETVRELHPDVILLDTWLGGSRKGVDLIRTFAADPALAAVPVLVCSSDPGAVEEQMRGIVTGRRMAVLSKPFSIEDLLSSVRELLKLP